MGHHYLPKSSLGLSRLMLESTVKVLSGHNSLCSLCGVVEIVLETISVANLLLEMTRLRYFENFSQRGL